MSKIWYPDSFWVGRLWAWYILNSIGGGGIFALLQARSRAVSNHDLSMQLLTGPRSDHKRENCIFIIYIIPMRQRTLPSVKSVTFLQIIWMLAKSNYFYKFFPCLLYRIYRGDLNRLFSPWCLYKMVTGIKNRPF